MAGLRIIATERHESRRIDNQLRGRSGRQGDPGASRFYLSLDDSLMRIFAGDRVRAIMDRLKMPEGEAIEAGIVSRSIEGAQRKVEARNFDIRKQLLEYDDVSNDQRKVIYQQRNEILEAASLDEQIANLRRSAMSGVVRTYVSEGSLEEQWDIPGLEKVLKEEWQLDLPLKEVVDKSDTITDEDILDKVVAAADELFTSKLQAVGAEQFTPFMRMVLLQSMDSHWREHLAALDYLRQGIHLRGYAQKNPKQEYKREAFELFSQLLDVVKMEVTRLLMTVRIQSQEQVTQAAEEIEARASQVGNVTYTHPNEDGSVSQEAGRGDLGRRQRAEGRPQRALSLRQRQEVQELPRQAGLRRALAARGQAALRVPTIGAPLAARTVMPVNLVAPDPSSLFPVRGVEIGVAMAGVRKANRRDLAVVTLAAGSSVAGVFTSNRFCAAPVLLCREHLAAGQGIRAILVNTGNANAGTGADGLARARSTCAALAARMGIKPAQVLPFSTGVIMETLPHERIEAALPAALADAKPDHWALAAEAIMTTDTVPKAASRQLVLGGKAVHITGISKGAGMIRPNMATMLGFVATDAAIAPAADAAPGARSRRCVLQPHHHRRRHLHQRLLRGDRHPPGRQCADHAAGAGRRRAAARGADRGVAATGAGHRARRRGRHQVHHRAGRRRPRRRRVPQGGLRHRPLAAGEDRVLRQRPEPGPHPGGSGLCRHRRPGPGPDRPVPRRRACRACTARATRPMPKSRASA